MDKNTSILLAPDILQIKKCKLCVNFMVGGSYWEEIPFNFTKINKLFLKILRILELVNKALATELKKKTNRLL